MRGRGRFAVLVGAQKSDVQLVALIGKDCGIAAKIRHGKFGCEDQPQIAQFPISIEVVTFTRRQFDHRAGIAGLLRAGLFQARDGGATLLHGVHTLIGGGRLSAPGSFLGGRGLLYLAGDVLQAYQNAGFQPRTGQFIGLGGRVEPVLDVIVLWRIQFGDAIRHTSAIGQDQPVGRNQRP